MRPLNVYYILKPLIPRSVQIFLRQQYASYLMGKFKDSWPIMEKAGEAPKSWVGWPNRKKFAVVLTHDVEKEKGHDRCLKLLEAEEALGFRSSFNFVPERYSVDPELRALIEERGYEVGVHGLNHDGKLFSNKQTFDERAVKINNYIKEWDSRGFRAPAMHHNLDWISELNIDYDLSTFDTDPFEPQSDGVHTIFPFIYTPSENRKSYVEIPYTLVQDFTLFIILKQKNIDIWKKKVDWIVSKGGLVLVNVHPDYINFSSEKSGIDEFPISYYLQLLNYIKVTYGDEYWQPLPHELADYLIQNGNSSDRSGL